MSLVKQLILAICLFLLVAFSGSFIVSLESSRNQLQTQLRSHAQDAATALGLSLTPHVRDPAMIELMVSSIFDSGYFARIRVYAVSNGEVLVERTRSLDETKAPGWFVNLVNLQEQAGDAIVMDGWQQSARVEVVSHPQFALNKLWDSALGTLAWLVACGLFSALLGALLLKRQLTPLMSMADQAEAITRREYRTLPRIPRTPELKHVVVAMNQMVGKLKTLFEEEAARTEHYRRQAYHDALTDLPNRLAFDHALAAALTSTENPDGMLLGLRVSDLNRINQQLGAASTDALLKSIGGQLQALQNAHPSWLCCRSRGGEFLTLAPGGDLADIRKLAEQLANQVASLETLTSLGEAQPIELGITGYRVGDDSKQVLRRLDQAMTESSLNGATIQPGYEPANESSQSPGSSHDWRELLEAALKDFSFTLHFQPVLHGHDLKQLLHQKALVRLRGTDGKLMMAGQFLPWIERLGLSPAFDRCMVGLALSHLQRHPGPLALSITNDTLHNAEHRKQIRQLLEQHRTEAAHLTLEVDARYLQGCDDLASLAQELRPLSVQVGLQHFGRQLSLIGELALIGLSYLKIESSFIRDLDTESDKHLYLEALVRTAQRIDLLLIAEQVQSQSEVSALKQLGIEAMQGRALAEPGEWRD
jgi:diguanylate cyclase (GGDEF)-like protein